MNLDVKHEVRTQNLVVDVMSIGYRYVSLIVNYAIFLSRHTVVLLSGIHNIWTLWRSVHSVNGSPVITSYNGLAVSGYLETGQTKL
jgi:hypothetical protein